jgi:transposase-like protein
MHAISYVRHRFPPRIIDHAVWLYLRFTLSYRDVEDLLAARGRDVSYETVRRWVLKFGPAVAQKLRTRGLNLTAGGISMPARCQCRSVSGRTIVSTCRIDGHHR